MKPPYAIGSVPSLSGHVIAYRWGSLPRVRRHRASKPQGSSERVLPWQITMDQLIFASLSHTHYWYEVGMLKVPAVKEDHHQRTVTGNNDEMATTGGSIAAGDSSASKMIQVIDLAGGGCLRRMELRPTTVVLSL